MTSANNQLLDGFQIYAPTTLAPARDLWTLRYSTTLENGSLVVSMALDLNKSNMVVWCYDYALWLRKYCLIDLSGCVVGPFGRGQLLLCVV